MKKGETIILWLNYLNEKLEEGINTGVWGLDETLFYNAIANKLCSLLPPSYVKEAMELNRITKTYSDVNLLNVSKTYLQEIKEVIDNEAKQ